MTYTRHDKVDWLEQTCSAEFMRKTLIDEMVNWMSESEFEEFYDHLCRMWDIKRDSNDPKYDNERDGIGE